MLLRLAMRVVDFDQSNASKYITAAGTNLMSDISEEATFIFEKVQAIANPLFRDVKEDNRDDFCVTKFMIENLKDSNDPRLEKYANKIHRISTKECPMVFLTMMQPY